MINYGLCNEREKNGIGRWGNYGSLWLVMMMDDGCS